MAQVTNETLTSPYTLRKVIREAIRHSVSLYFLPITISLRISHQIYQCVIRFLAKIIQSVVTEIVLIRGRAQERKLVPLSQYAYALDQYVRAVEQYLPAKEEQMQVLGQALPNILTMTLLDTIIQESQPSRLWSRPQAQDAKKGKAGREYTGKSLGEIIQDILTLSQAIQQWQTRRELQDKSELERLNQALAYCERNLKLAIVPVCIQALKQVLPEQGPDWQELMRKREQVVERAKTYHRLRAR